MKTESDSRSREGKPFARRATLKKMLQPRAARFHYKVGKFIQCANNHIVIFQTMFIFRTGYI